MTPRDQNQDQDQSQAEYGRHFKPEVKNVISLTLAFAKAIGRTQSDKSDNLIVSPYNALACLAMVALAADDKTRDELARSLFGTDAAGLDAAAKAYAALNNEVLDANKGQVEISTANAVWTNKDLVTLRKSFAENLKKNFGAEISAEDYADPATVKKINDWASKNTNGLIKEVLESLSGDDAAVLASALYFKGEWTHKFDKALTEDKTFTGDGSAVSTTPTMRQKFDEDGLRYLKGADFEAVALQYGSLNVDEDKYPTMRIILARPSDDNISARDWLAAQKSGAVPAWLDPYVFRSAEGPVELPRLDIKQTHDLIPALREMGISSAFQKGADFTRMVEAGGDKLYVSKVSHDVVFKTDEEGSEAAAVTTAVFTLECMPMPVPKVDVKFDRSFVFALQDVKTGAVLFVGAVNKPNNDMKAQQPKAPKL